MADVQLKNGYIRIASQLFEQFFIRDFSPIQLRILLMLIRLSYGCHKKTAKIKPQNLFNMAYVYEGDIKRELKHLERNKVIECNYEEKIFSLNKNFDEWKVSYHKLFDEEKFAKLLHINLSCGLRKNLVDNKEIEATKNETSLATKGNLSCRLSNNLDDNELSQPENTCKEGVSNQPINSIKDSIKDNNIYINNNKESKKIDPYINPYKKKFTEEYKKYFGTDCYLNNFQLQKLAEMAVEIENFEAVIPVLLEKFSKVSFNFNGEIKKPGLRWLIEEGNWADVLSGQFDEKRKELPASAYNLDDIGQNECELPASAYNLDDIGQNTYEGDFEL